MREQLYIPTYILVGRVKFEKESIHTTGYCDDGKKKHNGTNSLMITWIGVKGVSYSDKNDNGKMEIWLDEEVTNRWGDKPVYDHTD